MNHKSQLLRSALYIPASNNRALAKCSTLNADAFIFDLEDSVNSNKKGKARDSLKEFFINSNDELKNKSLFIRINHIDSEWLTMDLELVVAIKPKFVLIPKLESFSQIEHVFSRLKVAGLTNRVCIAGMIETPLGVLNVKELAKENSYIQGFILGTNDLAFRLKCEVNHGRKNLLFALRQTLLSARSFGLFCLDGVFNSFKDHDGFRKECIQSREMGFDGKTLIHPKQIKITNDIFSSSEEEIRLAKVYVKEFEKAINHGEGVAVVNGVIVEEMHYQRSLDILKKNRNLRNNSM